jgi:hypothetical protein
MAKLVALYRKPSNVAAGDLANFAQAGVELFIFESKDV